MALKLHFDIASLYCSAILFKMNKKQIVTQYQKLNINLFSTLDKLKELMEGEEYQNLVLNPDGDEDVEMMYGEFGVLVDGIGEAYN